MVLWEKGFPWILSCLFLCDIINILSYNFESKGKLNQGHFKSPLVWTILKFNRSNNKYNSYKINGIVIIYPKSSCKYVRLFSKRKKKIWVKVEIIEL